MWSKLKIIGLREEGRKKKPPMEQIIRSLNLAKKIIIMDECVGNDTLVIEALGKDYDVRALPKELKGRSDEYIRTILELNDWGLVSIDYKMAMRAKEIGINPIFLIIMKPGRRDMTMVSDGTYRLK